MMQDLEPLYSHEDEIPWQGDEPQEAGILRRRLCRSNDGSGWQLNGVDLTPHPARYRRQVVLVIASTHADLPVENERSVWHD
jgi:hypothetical protein